MKKINVLISLVIIVSMMFLCSPVVKADIGPKPSLEVNINYISKRDIKVEILTNNRRGEPLEYNEDYFDMDKELYDYLVNNDFDGYYSAQIYDSKPFGKKIKSNNDVYNVSFSYRYPRKFKLLIIDNTNNSVFISEEVTQKAFNSTMNINLSSKYSNNNYTDYEVVIKDLDIKEVHDLKSGITGIILRIIATIAIELFILYLFKYRNKKSFILVGITNFVTQLTLSLVLFSVFYFDGLLAYVFALVLGELIVIGSETIFYTFTLKENSRKRAIVYGLLANIITILVTFIPF